MPSDKSSGSTRRAADPGADQQLVAELTRLSVSAGEAIMAIYATDFDVAAKGDDSPVTAADEQAEAVILEGLREAAPGIPVVAEESVAAGNLPDISGGEFFLVDPLDGTREFISRNGEFTVNIALVREGMPALGVVHLPALGQTYWSDGEHAWRRIAAANSHGANDAAAQTIQCRAAPADGLDVIASRSHRDAKTDEYLARVNVRSLKSAGSSLKLCRIAEGEADLYPRLGRTMEWDIAAGHAVLLAAGGSVHTIDGAVLSYGKPGLDNPHFVARGL